MTRYISQTTLKLMLFLALGLFLTSCNTSTASHLELLEKKEITLPSGETLKAYIAKTAKEQKKGLSTIKSEDFSDREVMFFPANRMFVRQFWMPETHFDIDIIFLNQDLYVLDIHRNLKHFPAKYPQDEIPKSKEVFSQHVLEIKSSSPLAKKIKRGMILKWK